MRHVSEIVLSKLRTSKKSGNLTIDFDPKKLEYPPNKVSLKFLQNNIRYFVCKPSTFDYILPLLMISMSIT